MKRVFCILFLAEITACSSGKGDFGGTDAAAPAIDSGAQTNACATDTYPAGPYGTSVGMVVNPGLSWQGYLPNATSVSTIAPNDLYDCDGSKGIDAIIFDASAAWCAACQSQAANTPQLFQQYDALDIRVVALIVQDQNSAPATTATAEAWKTQYGLTDITVAADPAFSFAPPDESSVSLPVTIVVDPRSMKIMAVNQGYVAAYPLSPDPTASSIAKKNGAP